MRGQLEIFSMAEEFKNYFGNSLAGFLKPHALFTRKYFDSNLELKTQPCRRTWLLFTFLKILT